MKLQRNNKYKNKIALGLSTLMLSSLLLTGCSNEIEIPKIDDIPTVTQEVVVTQEPVATEMPIVTETPVVTPEPIIEVTPEPTPEVTETPVELTEEERIELEIEKLGLANPKREIGGEILYYISFIKDGQIKPKPLWVEMINDGNGFVEVKDILYGEVLLKLNYSDIVSAFETSNKTVNIYLFENLKKCEIILPYLDGAENINICRVPYMIYLEAWNNGDMSDDDCYDMINELIGIDMPLIVEMTIIEAEPGIKGDSVTNLTKFAKIETGAEIKVPLFIKEGDRIKVDTRTGEYVERISQ